MFPSFNARAGVTPDAGTTFGLAAVAGYREVELLVHALVDEGEPRVMPELPDGLDRPATVALHFRR